MSTETHNKIMSMSKLVYKKISKYPERFRDDLYQEGMIAVTESVRLHNQNGAASFAHYAGTAIDHALYKFMQYQRIDIRVPQSTTRFNAIRKNASKFGGQLTDTQDYNVFAKENDIKAEDVQTYFRKMVDISDYDFADDTDIERDAIFAETTQKLNELIENDTSIDVKVLKTVYLTGMSYRQFSEQFNMPKSTVAWRLKNIKAKLRELLS